MFRDLGLSSESLGTPVPDLARPDDRTRSLTLPLWCHVHLRVSGIKWLKEYTHAKFPWPCHNEKDTYICDNTQHKNVTLNTTPSLRLSWYLIYYANAQQWKRSPTLGSTSDPPRFRPLYLVPNFVANDRVRLWIRQPGFAVLRVLEAAVQHWECVAAGQATKESDRGR